ncbi:MAG: hypothetical protein OHK93_008579 [Ramalina farinacea]|uniref:Uncharacterized protein n=1 Tax=Ramalina farinacea TaxID=258253 RepID=A0AA43TS09_9LECA|nr:hypothetical protein [Ramalina farinacea]
MKFPRKYFNVQMYSQRRFHASVLYHNASSFWSFARPKKAGLLFVPGKPLALEPHTTAAVAIEDLLKRANRPLQLYNVSPDYGQNHFPRLALALIDDLVRLEQLGVRSLQSLPAKYKTSIIDDDTVRSNVETASIGDRPPPPEVQPVFEEGEHIYPVEEDDDVEYDALDLTIRSDFAANQARNQAFCKDDFPSMWIESDEEECADGAKPRVYERLDIPNDVAAEIYSDSHGGSSMNGMPLPPPSSQSEVLLTVASAKSSLAPHLFVMQIPCLDQPDAAEADDKFASMYRRYAYLTSHRDCKSVHAFRQEDPAFSRWLLVQESRHWTVSPYTQGKRE